MAVEHSKLDEVVTNFIHNISELSSRKLAESLKEYSVTELQEEDIEYMADEFAKYTKEEFKEMVPMAIKQSTESSDSTSEDYVRDEDQEVPDEGSSNDDDDLLTMV